MAMNKAEKAAMEALEREIAFRWPTMPEPKRMVIPEPMGKVEVVDGYDYNLHTRTVRKCWTGSVRHGEWYDGRRSSHASQNGKALYATEADALIALRWAICREVAGTLHGVDRLIAMAGQS